MRWEWFEDPGLKNDLWHPELCEGSSQVGNHFPLLNKASTMWCVFHAFWGFVSHSWRCSHDSQLQTMCRCQRWKMEKYIKWNYVSMQSVVTLNPLFTISAVWSLKGEETMWVHALYWSYSWLLWFGPNQSEKSNEQFPLGWIQGDSFPEELKDWCLGKRGNCQKALCDSLACAFCLLFLPIHHVNPACGNPIRTVKREGLGVNKSSVSGMLAWVFICSLFFLFSFLDVVIIFWKTLSNLHSLTPKFLHCPSVPFKMFPSDMFLHVTSLFSHIRYMSSMGRLSSPMFHDELKTKLATELVTYAFDFSSVGNFSKISTLCNTE